MSAELDTKDALDMERVPAPVKELAARLNGSATVGTAGAQLDIMARILTATTEEELFAAADAGTISGQDIPNQPFLITDWEYKRTAPGYIAEGAFPFYVLLRVRMIADGKEHVVSCGGFTFVSVVDGLDRMGVLSAAIANKGGYPMFIEARRMSSGFDVLIPHPYAMPTAA